MTETGPQRRRFPRYRANLEAVVFLGAKTVTARITQVSRGGCLIFPPLPPQQNPGLKLSFRLAEDMPSINCKGVIVYSINDVGTGVAFREISLYNQDLITDYFQKHVGAEKPSSP